MIKPQFEKIEPLSTEEIEQMNTYLREFPPLVGPPADLPFFDVRRIAHTLLYLTRRLDNSAKHENDLALDVRRLEKKLQGTIEAYSGLLAECRAERNQRRGEK